MGCCCAFGNNNTNNTDQTTDIKKLMSRPYYLIATIYPNSKSSLMIDQTTISSVTSFINENQQNKLNLRKAFYGGKEQVAMFHNTTYDLKVISPSLFKYSLCCNCCCSYHYGVKYHSPDYSWILWGVNENGAYDIQILAVEQFLDAISVNNILKSIIQLGYSLDTHFLNFPQVVARGQYYTNESFKTQYKQQQGFLDISLQSPNSLLQQPLVQNQFANQQQIINNQFYPQQQISGLVQLPLYNYEQQQPQMQNQQKNNNRDII